MAWWFDQRDVRRRELADRLREMINAAERGEKTTMAALFGILYRQEIKDARGAAGIAKLAGSLSPVGRWWLKHRRNQPVSCDEESVGGACASRAPGPAIPAICGRS